MRRRWISALLWMALFPACSVADSIDGRDELRLVIDAGSSGLRWCTFQVRQHCEGEQCRCAVEAAAPCRRFDGGLAVQDGPKEIQASLAPGADALSRSERAAIRQVALLGTGGYRALPPGTQAQRIARAREALRELFPQAVVTASVLSGADEGRLAWKAVALNTGRNDHMILETGGATVQFADSRGRSSSVPCGINALRERLQGRSDFASCRTENATADFQRCRQLVASELRSPRCRLPSGNANAPIFALGAAWSALTGGANQITFAELEQRGAQACAARGEAAESDRHRLCYLFAYETEMLKMVGASQVQTFGESWPRGAALTAPYFPQCRDDRWPDWR